LENNDISALGKRLYFGELMYTMMYVHEKGFTHGNLNLNKILLRDEDFQIILTSFTPETLLTQEINPY
jgi:hypothetical protein